MPNQITARRWVGINPQGKIDHNTVATSIGEAWRSIDWWRETTPTKLRAKGWRVKRCTITVDIEEVYDAIKGERRGTR